MDTYDLIQIATTNRKITILYRCYVKIVFFRLFYCMLFLTFQFFKLVLFNCDSVILRRIKWIHLIKLLMLFLVVLLHLWCFFYLVFIHIFSNIFITPKKPLVSVFSCIELSRITFIFFMNVKYKKQFVYLGRLYNISCVFRNWWY
jgi:hypothetical protein